MANQETKQIDSIISSRRALLAMGGAALAGLALTKTSAVQAASYTDNDILNFALNLEYLEAQFYTLAASGQTIDQIGIGIGAGTTAAGTGTVVTKPGGPASCKVTFTNSVIADYAKEIAGEEQSHVKLLRSTLGSMAVAMPNLDLYNSFTGLGNLLGISNFDPFANDVAFLLGSYIFEDVGVTAYHGAAPLIVDKTNVLPPAVEIHAVEAEHSGMVRFTLYSIDMGNIVVPGYTAGSLGMSLSQITQAISGKRNMFDQVAYTDDYGLPTMQVPLNSSADSSLATGSTAYTSAMIFDIPTVAVPASAATGTTAAVAGNNNNAGLGYSRTTGQVINIVTAPSTTDAKTMITSGGFFPAGLNGYFQTGYTAPAAS